MVAAPLRSPHSRSSKDDTSSRSRMREWGEDKGGDELIQMRGVVKTFKNAAGEFTVLHGIDLTIRQGDFVAIVGKSGSGKSTLLNMITGIDHPTRRTGGDRRDGYLQDDREPALAVAR